MRELADPIFSDSFLETPVGEIMTAISGAGYFAAEGALRAHFVEQLVGEVEAERIAVNHNGVAPVFAEHQTYLSHTLAASRSCFDLVTHTRLLDVSQARFGAIFRLKAQRYYETHDRHVMEWHTDNKTDRKFEHIPGIIFVFYLCDVIDGEFQYVTGSHRWSGDLGFNMYDDEFIERRCRKDIVSFKLPSGSLLIYDSYGIHRAKPIETPGFTRRSLLCQVDQRQNGERILVNTSFVKDVDQRLMTYLGFGQPADYRTFPATSIRTLPWRRMWELQMSLVAATGYRMARDIYRHVVPIGVRQRLKDAFATS